MTCACGDKPKWSPGDPEPVLEKPAGVGADLPVAAASASSSGIGTGVVIGLALGLVIGGVVGVYLAGVNEDENTRRRQLVERRRAAGYAY